MTNEEGASAAWFENRELAFLRNVRLLYQDYLDGSPLHRSDTKASVQLLGNLALSNLRRSHLGHLLREGRTIDRLDLSRAGGFIRRPLSLVQLHHADAGAGDGPALARLQPPRDSARSPGLFAASVRQKFRNWLADRLKIDPDEVWVPELSTTAYRARRRALSIGFATTEAGHCADRRHCPQRGWGFSGDGRVHGRRFSGGRPRARLRDSCSVRATGCRARAGATASRMSGALSAAFRCTSFRWPRARSTRSHSIEAQLSGGRIVLLPLVILGCPGKVLAAGFRSILPWSSRDPPSAGRPPAGRSA